MTVGVMPPLMLILLPLDQESLERAVDPDHLHPLAMTIPLAMTMVTGDLLLPGHLAQAAPAVASLERVVDPVESLARAADQVPQAVAQVITSG